MRVVTPALEMAQDTRKLVSWRKKEGETVIKGEILLEIETDKVVVEVEALADGVLAGVKAQPSDVIPVGRRPPELVQNAGWPGTPRSTPTRI
jgi:pyruvate/2-oxoglutarate dehydrogenase complex dihydrolipoamide acyltransferase (E2) component